MVFGQVIKGLGVARTLENVEVNGEKPAKLCVIADCGELKEGDGFPVADPVPFSPVQCMKIFCSFGNNICKQF